MTELLYAFMFALIVVILLHGIVTAQRDKKRTDTLEAINNALERIAAKLEEGNNKDA